MLCKQAKDHILPLTFEHQDLFCFLRSLIFDDQNLDHEVHVNDFTKSEVWLLINFEELYKNIFT